MNKEKVSFKAYTMAQASLIPPSWEELIPAEHLVWVVNQVIEQIEMKPLVEQYMGRGTSSYHPRMMLKMIVYAYAERIDSSRKIAKALRETVNFMWLSGGKHFRTINGFRSGRLDETVRAVFTEVLELLLEGYVRMENYFVDGTKIMPPKSLWHAQRITSRLGQRTNSLSDTAFINRLGTPPAIFPIWSNRPFPKACNRRMGVAMRDMAAKRTMSGWKNMKSKTISNTIPSTKSNIHRASENWWKRRVSSQPTSRMTRTRMSLSAQHNTP